MKRLVRLRADPSKIRIGVRRLPETSDWRVSVWSRALNVPIAVVEDKDPGNAVFRALRLAEKMCAGWVIKGLDRAMENVYRHPWLEEGDGS